MISQRRIYRTNYYEPTDGISQQRPRRRQIIREEPEQTLVSRLLSSVTEDVLKSVIFSIALAVPCIRRALLGILLSVFLIGAVGMALLVYSVSSFLR